MHLDVKPGNFLIDEFSLTVKLCDFGMSARLGENVKRLVVTGAYRAPELWTQDPSPTYIQPAADIFSYGCTVFELFSRANLLVELTKSYSESDGRVCMSNWCNIHRKGISEARKLVAWRHLLVHSVEFQKLVFTCLSPNGLDRIGGLEQAVQIFKFSQ